MNKPVYLGLLILDLTKIYKIYKNNWLNKI